MWLEKASERVMKNRRLGDSRLARWLLPVLALGAALLTMPAGAAPEGARWKAALEPLYGLPVQDFGFIRSGWTFGENHLRTITGSATLEGLDPLQATLWLMADPHARHAAPLIKTERPQLAEALGGKRVSLSQYRAPQAREKLMALYERDPAQWLKPINAVENRALMLEELEQSFAIVPRPGEWLSPLALRAGDATLSANDLRIGEQWQALKRAIAGDDPEAGGRAAAGLAEAVEAEAQARGIELPPLALDVFYHRHAPFAKSAAFCLLAALAFGATLLTGRWPRQLGWLGVGLLGLALGEQLLGIGLRWVLSGRAPLSNMYESFTFAVAGMVLFAILFEVVQRNRLIGLGGAALGFIFMVLAHRLPVVFDPQIRPLMPALQSSWLTYHVVTIMLSYSAFALSCFLGVTYLGKAALGGDGSQFLLARRLPGLATLDLLNYKVIAVGFPLLTIGIITGAVWAATAWGRPWGFDPKETWSAITWLVYAIYLHVRYLGGWRGRRAAWLSLVGFAAVLFTYFGVNYLLSGLHSYV